MFSPDSRILLIDDFELTRVTLRIGLTNLGYKHLDEADDGDSALKKIVDAYGSGKPYDLIFCDWNMPNLSGLELLKKIRQDNRFVRLPFIMVTAEADRANVIEALIAGANDYVVKPFDADIISKKIEMVAKKLTSQKSA
ncbi:MAG: response regulator [Bdellovibrionaceae bacterium]|nr:response regulator [Bdellovibrionales bacterium]MCB9082721.1 response regulator [Pseudobdellovibrionaceae bacterium]